MKKLLVLMITMMFVGCATAKKEVKPVMTPAQIKKQVKLEMESQIFDEWYDGFSKELAHHISKLSGGEKVTIKKLDVVMTKDFNAGIIKMSASTEIYSEETMYVIILKIGGKWMQCDSINKQEMIRRFIMQREKALEKYDKEKEDEEIEL